VVPTSYVATPGEGSGQGGAFDYLDDTGSQLNDDEFGDNNWNADLGDGNAYEWIGWKSADPSMTFTFSGVQTITSVTIDFNRTEFDGIFLPNLVNIGGTAFALNGTELGTGTRGGLVFNGLWTGSTLGITLSDGDTGRWIFVDEVDFDSGNQSAVPEPGSAILLLLGGAAFAAVRKFRPRAAQ
jgi:hypothetical protein